MGQVLSHESADDIPCSLIFDHTIVPNWLWKQVKSTYKFLNSVVKGAVWNYSIKPSSANEK